jgi:Porin PorA
MRRVAGLVLSALGTFLIVLALLTRFVVVSQAVKFPLNENEITTLVASNASYFSPAKVAEVTGATLEDTLTTQGNNAAGNSGTAVWQEFSYVYDRTNALTVNYTTQTLAFDRRSGELVNCCGSAIGTNTSAHVSGLGYVWPFNAQKKTYQVFNTTLMKTVPAVYAGTATVDGENTYVYVENIPPTQNGTIAVPGTLIGQKSAASVTLPEYYTAKTTEYVDPITGGPVKGISYQHIYLQDSSGNQVLNVINANFATTPATNASTVNTVKSDDGKIDLISFILPVVLGIVGIVMLIMGLIMVVAGRRGEVEYEDGYEDEREPGEVQV